MSESIFNATKGIVECITWNERSQFIATEERVIMQNAMINLENGKYEENGIKQSVRVLLDSGSQRTYISKDITDKLKLL